MRGLMGTAIVAGLAFGCTTEKASTTAATTPSATVVASVASVAPEDLKAGDPAPDFEGTGDDGRTYSLASLRGRTVVLYFYPKDDTPGCTVEAQEFRDESPQFEAKGAVVLGVSMDDAASHQAFRAKYDLNFPLIAKGDAIAKAYGVPVRLGFASRQTFVIGPDGTLLKVFRSVTPKGHAKEILELL